MLSYNKGRSAASITTPGHILFYSTEDSYSKSLNRGKVDDEDLYNLFPITLKKGYLAIDAGANYGYFTMHMAEIVSNNGGVMAVELNPRNVDYMHHSFAVNSFKNIKTLNLGISDKTYISSMCRDPIYQEDFSLGTSECISSDDTDVEKLFNNLNMSTMDSIVGPKHCASQIDLIRMDIEGNECKGILGAKSIITDSENLIISFEWQDVLISRYSVIEEQKECLDILKNNKYHIFKTSDYIKFYGMKFSDMLETYEVPHQDVLGILKEDYVALTETSYSNRINDTFLEKSQDCLDNFSSINNFVAYEEQVSHLDL